MEAKRFKITIFGESYIFLSDEPEEHLVESARMVDAIMRKISEQTSATDAKRIAVLAALQVASKVLILESQLKNEEQEQEKLLKRLEHTISPFTSGSQS